ncbi:MAG: hypothetical protein FWG83_06635 [Oscillospiraceae bacterium]|nr:hypothetical protein [Oscillospiraceae bacterium]
MTKKNTLILAIVVLFAILMIPIAILIIGPMAVEIFGGSSLDFFIAFVYSVAFMPVWIIIGIFIIILISCKRLKSDIAELEQELEELEESEEE